MLVLVLSAGQDGTAAAAIAHASAGSSTSSPAMNAAVKEAIAKAKSGGSASEGLNGQAFGKLTGGNQSEEAGGEEAGGEEEGQGGQTKTRAASTSASKAPSTGLVVGVFAIAALLLGGIAFYIVRDARGMAPASDGFVDALTSRTQAARTRKRRTKAKAARAARKRNR